MKFALIALLLGAVATAAPLSREPGWYGVKVISRSLKDGRRFFGSGLLLQSGGKAYAVTSDHVVIHGEAGFAHEIYTPVFPPKKTYKARLAAVEWATGLALLEIPQMFAGGEFPNVTDFKPEDPVAGEPVTLVGYPADSKNEIVDPRGRIAEVRSPSSRFVDVPWLYRIAGAHGEFGMSGGPLMASNTSLFRGLLTSQLLTAGPIPENQLFVIPAAFVYAWLSKVLPDPTAYHSAFSQPPQLQYEGHGDVITGDIQFTMSHYWGTPTLYAVTSALRQRLTDRDADDPAGIFPALRDFTTRNEGETSGVVFLCFRERAVIGGGCKEHYDTLAEFFRLLARPDLEAMAVTSINDRDKIVESFTREVARLKRDLSDVPDSKLKDDLEKIRSESRDGFISVKPTDVWRLIQGAEYAMDWQAFEKARPGRPALLKQQLRAVLKVLRKLTV